MKKSLILTFLTCAAGLACAREVKLSCEAVDIEVGGGTYFWMYYPEVKVNGDAQRPSKVEKNGNVATLSYKHGAKLELTAAEDHLAFRFLETPGGVNDVKFHLVMPTDLGAKGAKWRIAGKKGDFPKAKGPTKIFQGNAGDFTATWGKQEFSVLFPETFSWTEFQDLRTWNWDALGVAAITPFNADKRIVVMPFGLDKAKLPSVRARVEAACLAKNGNAAPRAVKAAKPSLKAWLSN